jgi:hypothetical protein
VRGTITGIPSEETVAATVVRAAQISAAASACRCISLHAMLEAPEGFVVPAGAL